MISVSPNSYVTIKSHQRVTLNPTELSMKMHDAIFAFETAGFSMPTLPGQTCSYPAAKVDHYCETVIFEGCARVALLDLGLFAQTVVRCHGDNAAITITMPAASGVSGRLAQILSPASGKAIRQIKARIQRGIFLA